MSESMDSGRFSGQRQEKTMFSQTCNLLREYLKEKGPLGDLSLSMTLALEQPNSMPEPYRATSVPTNNLLPNCVQPQNVTMPKNVSSMNLFPEQAGFGASAGKKDLPKMAVYSNSNKSDSRKAQMTIFYAGQIIVFDDFPAERAKEVMNLASMGSSKAPNSSCNAVKNLTDSASLIPAVCSDAKSNVANNLSRERALQAPQPVVCGLARKASLTRFLEKRKDRINARAPYNVSNTASDPFKHAESKSWLGLASQS